MNAWGRVTCSLGDASVRDLLLCSTKAYLSLSLAEANLKTEPQSPANSTFSVPSPSSSVDSSAQHVPVSTNILILYMAYSDIVWMKIWLIKEAQIKRTASTYSDLFSCNKLLSVILPVPVTVSSVKFSCTKLFSFPCYCLIHTNRNIILRSRQYCSGVQEPSFSMLCLWTTMIHPPLSKWPAGCLDFDLMLLLGRT